MAAPITQAQVLQQPFGPNVLVFTPGQDSATQAAINRVYAGQEHAEFGNGRYAFLFAPGEYHVNVPVGFYTEVLGLGRMPDSTHIVGDVHADAALKNNNATTTFWRAAENFSVTPTHGDTNGTLQWAVSQAVSFRRMHVLGDMVLHQKHGWASGGWMSDTRVDGNVDSGSQQQWISRNAEWRSWTGASWNMVFVGVNHPPAGEWPKPPYTRVTTVPVLREKPFLQWDGRVAWSVRVPALRHDTRGVSWADDAASGRSLPLRDFYVTQPGRDSAATMNAALQRGKHLLLTPGTYELDAPLHVSRPRTVIMGLGFATLKPVHGTAAVQVDDVDGVSVSGVLFDAGEQESPALLEIGKPGVHRSHATDPIALFDVFFRVGGAAVGKVKACLVVNSDDTLIDDIWIWRADHGAGVGWTSNTSDNGLIVRGDRVTAYGLFVEHHQQYQVLWSGNAGRTYFYQSEIPYDPPTQAAWTDPNGANGWASYKVTAASHQAWGLGVYSVFRHPDVVLSRAIEVPRSPEVQLHHMMTTALDTLGAIENVVDDAGGPTQTKPRTTPEVAEFPTP
ncbi:coagulation factor 5/8 type domain-containing protein [Terriglobus sp.]|uniref:coagulation factor 5/8 type domain-containing protein n=1 Tax=Terriglobus sp. TaxID=1889013 RepID=UPI003B000052